MADVSLEDARRVLSAQPFSRLVGAVLEQFGPDRVVLRVPIADDLLQHHGYVHGGVVSYAADSALTFAGGLALGSDILTGGIEVSYLRPMQHGDIVAEAWVDETSGRTASCRCDLYEVTGDGVRTLCATASGTIVTRRR